MQRIIFFFIVTLLVRSFPTTAQSAAPASFILKEEQRILQSQLNKISIDSAIVFPLSKYVKSAVDSIQLTITSEAVLAAEKEKATRSLGYFVQQLGENIAQEKFDLYDIPGAIQSYKTFLKALMYRKPIDHLLVPLEARRTQLLARAFRQYPEFNLIDDIAVYKRMAATPAFIIRFLETKPAYRFADSLLLHAAVHDPYKFNLYLRNSKPAMQKVINNSDNIYLQQIVTLLADRNSTELLPFLVPITEQMITPDSIMKTRLEVIKYFQMLVNTMKESIGVTDPTLQKMLRRGIKEKALSFYVNYINEQHGAKDAVRFAPVKDLRPEDIYYIITSCGDELYTSSYLGLYKRLMMHFKDQSADSLFNIVQYDNFRTFMRLAANYNTFTDFLKNMSQEHAATILKRFVSGVESDVNTGLEKAMDIADSFTGLDSAVEIRSLVQNEIQSNLHRCQNDHLYFGVRLYGILSQVFDLVKQKGSFNQLWTTLGNYETLKRRDVLNKKGETIEMVLFYGDEDGTASFSNFLKLFKDTKKWAVEKNDSWVTVRSLADEPIVIYANLPLDNKEELDLKAQDAMIAHLQQQSLEPTILIHRGHSYHVENTLKKIKPSVRLAILGSCGGYNQAISIANINPDAQIIVSKKTGSKSINDPIIDAINETLLNKNDLVWSGIWSNLSARFSKDETMLNLFNEYIPPSKNVSLFVLKLFNLYNRVV